MRLRILHVPDCPHVDLLERRLHVALADVPVSRHVVADPAVAAELGMRASPALLVEGFDPPVAPGCCAPTGLSCHVDPERSLPSTAELCRLLGGGGLEHRDDGTEPREWRRRATPSEPAERAVYQAVLRSFAGTGGPPTRDELDLVAARAGSAVPAAELLARLHAADALRLDARHEIAVAYPFSARPTRHRVRLASGVEAHAMCMIDALGVPAMLGTDATISTADPTDGRPIAVTVTGGAAVWTPATAVVFVSDGAGRGPSADSCCPYLDAFADRAAARAWMDAHPDVPGLVLDPPDAQLLGERIFGALLGADPEPGAP